MRTFAAGFLLSLTAAAAAVPVGYTSEIDFLNALAALGYNVNQEGFENDAVWGIARTPITQSSVTSNGITWTPSAPISGITTGSGAARTGQWGLYCLPHGDWDSLIRDGWTGQSAQPLVAIGGWITGSHGSGIGLYLDDQPLNLVDFGPNGGILTGLEFFGVIDTDGFSRFDYREQEATPGDWKIIFSDDFSFARAGDLIDCNENGIADPLDIAAGTSTDCNNNNIPDECEIDINSTAPGGPFFCTANCDPDCNDNGDLDACEVVEPEVHSSGQLSPIGFGSPQSFTIVSAPTSRANVILDFTALANLGGNSDQINVDVNGVPVGSVFALDGSDCPEELPDTARLVVPMATFNNAVGGGGGNATINMVATLEVFPDECTPTTWISVDVTLFVPSPLDLNGDGIPDECAPPVVCIGDLDADNDTDVFDFGIFAVNFGSTVPPGTLGDLDNDGDVDVFDFGLFATDFGCP